MKGARQMLNRHIKEVLIAVALKFGTSVSPNAKEIVLPVWGRGLADKYTVIETEYLDSGRVVYRVERKDGPHEYF